MTRKRPIDDADGRLDDTVAAARSTRFGTQHEGGAQLRRDGAEIQRGADRATIHDAPGCDHRHTQPAHQQAHQHRHAQPGVVPVGVEAAAMPTRFDALRNHHVHAGVLGLQAFVQTGHAGQQCDAQRV